MSAYPLRVLVRFLSELLDILLSNLAHDTTSESKTMTDSVHFTEFPAWNTMNFSQDCKAWGEWYATYLSASPWNNTRYLDGDVSTIFHLFTSSVPDDWREPEDWSYATYYGQVLDWYGFNY